jgi:hypothetical protein
MTATLTFNLPDDQYEYNYTLNAVRYKDALSEIMDAMHNEVKYGNYDKPTNEVLANLYEQFVEITDNLLDA